MCQLCPSHAKAGLWLVQSYSYVIEATDPLFLQSFTAYLVLGNRLPKIPFDSVASAANKSKSLSHMEGGAGDMSSDKDMYFKQFKDD